MERAKEKGFTQPASIVVKPIQTRGRIVRSSMSSISYAQDFVNSDFMKNNEKKEEFSNKLRDFFYIGEKYVFEGDGEFERKARRVIRMRRFKRILACAAAAFCFTVVACGIVGIVHIFLYGGAL